jgi:hypothetical protein
MLSIKEVVIVGGYENICGCERAIIELLVGPEIHLSLADIGWTRTTAKMPVGETYDGTVDVIDGTHIVIWVGPGDMTPEVFPFLHDSPESPEDQSVEVVCAIRGDLPILGTILPVIAWRVCNGESVSQWDPEFDCLQDEVDSHVDLIGESQLDLEILSWIPVGAVLDDVAYSGDSDVSDWFADLPVIPNEFDYLLL